MDLKLHDLTTGYGRHTVSHNLNARLQTGLLTCLLGPNGSGKSTLLRTISGAQPPLSGTVTPTDNRTLSIVLTSRIDISHLRACDVVAMGRHPYTGYFGKPSPQDDDIIRQAMQTTGTLHLSHRNMTSLSDGEAQKVMIAKALAQQTPVILLDEPSAFLDFPSKVSLMLMMQDLAHNHGKTILLSTHDISLAIKTADTLWLMNADGTMHTGTPRQLIDTGHIATYLGDSSQYL